MLKIIFLIMASILTIMTIVALIRGKKYVPLVEGLDSSEYFLKELYIIGFFLGNTKLFRLRGNFGRNLKSNAKLVWDNIYSEYYANLVWAQFLTFALILLAIGFAAGSFFDGAAAAVVLAVAVIAAVCVWYVTIGKMNNIVAERRSECEYEFPNMISKLSLLISSGMILREAWQSVAYGKDGPLYDLMKKSCEEMENGESDKAAIHKFGILSDSSEIRKFTGMMIQGMDKGNRELSDFLISQSSELWDHKKQLALQKGSVAEGKLVIPLGLMFAGVILIIIAAAMQSFSF